ncbi:hypothetical protein GC105_11825 [Alkalibaculum sp. M08DMB]|uniref:Uncharacterized protein n=1 Tax=Alkalibaculum sporogenes TaxID=2655001 RepID=A0A6A7KAA7_9FIRM|nr:hypothetical protein [Alkalibaculum sporogenes]MPW26479.1 hypothetical protein [Alkalibaculum sporogenes]
MSIIQPFSKCKTYVQLAMISSRSCEIMNRVFSVLVVVLDDLRLLSYDVNQVHHSHWVFIKTPVPKPTPRIRIASLTEPALYC